MVRIPERDFGNTRNLALLIAGSILFAFGVLFMCAASVAIFAVFVVAEL